MREILLLPRRESSKSTGVRAEIRGVEIAVGTWRSGEVRGFLDKIGNDKSECFSFVAKISGVVEDNL